MTVVVKRTTAKATAASRAASRAATRAEDKRTHTSSLGHEASAVAPQSANQFYAMEPIERMGLVQQGVPANVVNLIADDMQISKEKLYATVGVARATIDRKLRERKLLSPDESERVLGMARLVGQVDTMVRESGRPAQFDAAQWLAAWLDRPNAALGGKPPAQLMSTVDGRAMVSTVIGQMQAGSYA